MRRVLVIAAILIALPISVFAKDNANSSNAGAEIDQYFKNTWEALAKSSVVWPQIEDNQTKAKIVALYIDIFRKNGIKITNSPVYYVKRINDVYNENPALFKNPLNVVLQTIAIIDYDFDNRQDKDFLAKQVLGEQGFIANKKRLGLMK